MKKIILLGLFFVFLSGCVQTKYMGQQITWSTPIGFEHRIWTESQDKDIGFPVWYKLSKIEDKKYILNGIVGEKNLDRQFQKYIFCQASITFLLTENNTVVDTVIIHSNLNGEEFSKIFKSNKNPDGVALGSWQSRCAK